ncbi:hypothetical protein ROA7745_00124 [Roseovarius aestuarii]|uniref:Uncharacterized protein n=2 Tax=Roseovarius aestuarii TaxID=475083 RepID=A0A1X7BKY8_9RHOB|nr:hypothetical protein ROA7745_00124 [Roseovarius aestuarii]
MQGLEDGNLHLFKWLLKYANKLPAKYSSYPESFLVEMLGELANAQARHYQKVSPAGHWYEFINELRRAFEEFGEKVCATDKSIFGGTLIELDRQFPGLVFPPQSVGNEERRSYVRRAFNNRNRSQD